MMAPERYEEAAAATAPVSSGIADAAQPGSAVSNDRAPPSAWWPPGLRSGRGRLQKRPRSQRSETSPESSEESEDERWHGGSQRVHDEEDSSDAEQSSEGSSAPALDESATTQDSMACAHLRE